MCIRDRWYQRRVHGELKLFKSKGMRHHNRSNSGNSGSRDREGSTEVVKVFKIHVRNLEPNTDESNLRSQFERFGRVKKVRLGGKGFADPENAANSGYGYVFMTDKKAAEDAANHFLRYPLHQFRFSSHSKALEWSFH
eukprot:TRINITY_DN2871_c0_g1_i1.p1 TRINITY_DN2871_c0_g1~~TRINITY_DN2871_c0_g1_i1.p1  ORF type:complete len:157 (+),score=29.13 TRINITY_DN2871_c0_g1_i1:60-473(+)